MTTSVPTIAFDYRPSRWLDVALLVMLALVGLALLLCAAPGAVKLGLFAVALALTLYDAWRRGRGGVLRLVWHGSGEWRAHAADVAAEVAELSSSTRIGRMLVLRFRLPARRRLVAILLPDNLEQDTYRRLCVRLARVRNEALRPPVEEIDRRRA